MLRKAWEVAKGLLLSQRGEVGNLELTEEELSLISTDDVPEGDPPEKAPEVPAEGDPPALKEGEVPEKPPEEGAAPVKPGEVPIEPETKPDESEETGSPRYQKRIDGLIRESREAQEKLELLRTNPDEYYRTYPDESPPSGQASPHREAIPQEAGVSTPRVESLQQLPSEFDVDVAGGDYDGKAFTEVYQTDPDYAHKTWPRLAVRYEWHLLDEQKNQERQRAEEAESSKRETSEFFDEVAGEQYGGKYESLSPAEKASVEAEFNRVMGWIKENNFALKSSAGWLRSARILMDPDAAKSRARAEGAKQLLDKARHGHVQTISAKTESAPVSGWEWWETASEDQLSAALDKMKPSTYKRFLKTAPESVKNRDILQNMPWG